MEITKNNTLTSAIFGIYRLLIIFFTLFVIYFAQSIVIPITIAALLTFFLSPLVTKLERWVGKIVSILFVVIVVFLIIGVVGYIFANQLILFGSKFQNYYEIIQTKIQTIQFPQWGIFEQIGESIKNFKQNLLGESTRIEEKVAQSEVKLIDLGSHFTRFIEVLFGSMFNFIWMSGIVILLVIFMLLNKEDIRSRAIKLLGRHRIGSTINAINDASERVFNYLYRFLIVNIGFGICVTVGLYLLHIPNPVLWGCLGAILRFIPYIGPWIAAIIPISLSFVISSSWSLPLFTILFFIVLELVTAYVIEPYYYGIGTGVSPFALILAAIFWTWLWGPIGLLVSTPLTVCLVVLGQYISNMSFLSVLFSQEQALTFVEECYHRLLSFESSGETIDLIENYIQKNSLISFYDAVLIPIISQAEIDFHFDLIDFNQKEDLYQNVREVIELLSLREQKNISSVPKTKGKILCLSASSVRDELGVTILSQLLALESFEVHQTNANLNENFELIEKRKPDIVCLVVVAPYILSKARFLCTKIHKYKPDLPIVICIFGSPEPGTQALDKMNTAKACIVVNNLAHAMHKLNELRLNWH